MAYIYIFFQKVKKFLHVGLLIYTLNLSIITIGWPPWVGPMRASSPYPTVPFPSVTDILRDHKSTKNKPTS